jgi:hypothetical protein
METQVWTRWPEAGLLQRQLTRRQLTFGGFSSNHALNRWLSVLGSIPDDSDALEIVCHLDVYMKHETKLLFCARVKGT